MRGAFEPHVSERSAQRFRNKDLLGELKQGSILG